MYIKIAKTFSKEYKKLGFHDYTELFRILERYPDTPLLKTIGQIDQNILTIKGYLSGKRFRILILLQKIQNIFVPISILKKETKIGRNIRKEIIEETFDGNIDRIMEDIRSGNFETFEI